MQDTLIISLFAIVFLGGIGYILGYQLMKYLKGSLKIILPKKNYDFGEKLWGIIHLHAKKHISSHTLLAHIIVLEKRRIYTNKGSRTDTVEIFRKSYDIEGPTQYLPGVQKDFSLDIEIPQISDFPENIQTMIIARDTQKKSFLQQYVRSYTSRQIVWQLRVDLDAEGIDLSARESLYLSIPIHRNNI